MCPSSRMCRTYACVALHTCHFAASDAFACSRVCIPCVAGVARIACVAFRTCRSCHLCHLCLLRCLLYPCLSRIDISSNFRIALISSLLCTRIAFALRSSLVERVLATYDVQTTYLVIPMCPNYAHNYFSINLQRDTG